MLLPLTFGCLYFMACFLTPNSWFNAFFRSDCGVNECRMINSVDFVLARNESFETPPSTMTQHRDSYCCSSPVPRLMFLPHCNHNLPHAFKRKSHRLKFACSSLSWDAQIRMSTSGFSSWRCRICACLVMAANIHFLTNFKTLEHGSDFL